MDKVTKTQNQMKKKEEKLLSKKTKRDEKNSTSFFKEEEMEMELNKEEDQNGNNSNKQQTDNTNANWINKTRTLIVASRGVSHQERHLINDLIGLIPNAKKECKIEKETAKEELTEICYNHNCKYCLYFEHRKRELVLWIFKSPEGPCAKFQIRNIHALNEIKLMGNCIKYSRPLLSFDKSFDEMPHLQILKLLFIQTFNSPKNHPKTKPFYDHMICFYNVNNQIFFRNYQILNEIKEKFINIDNTDKLNLLEIGPRFSMNLIRVFEGALGGKTLYLNQSYASPGMIFRKKLDNFKKRRMKNNEEKRELDEKMANANIVKQKWLEEDN